jgi:hypothetical protein
MADETWDAWAQEYGRNTVRCLAYGSFYELLDLMPACPRRYMSPHDEKFMEAVALKLDEAGALSKPSVEQHRAAIRAALAERRSA